MTEQATFIRDSIVTFGAGVVALVLVFGIIILAIFKVPKFFQTWREMVQASDADRQQQLKAITELTAITAEVIRSNATAFQEASKSTDNMAKALELLTAMYERTSKDLYDHDVRAQIGWSEVAKISERTVNCQSRWNSSH